MIKRFAYIVLLLILTPCLLSAKKRNSRHTFLEKYSVSLPLHHNLLTDTSKNAKPDDKKKVKEIAKAKREPKPEKIITPGSQSGKVKPKRQRRPEGLEQPPEIPRRSGGG